ncbi:transposase [Hyphomicrobium sp.]|uniref:transposase n=1 Tax=Hyphomicrobium sp. TaxID=82 RepID=UPI00356A7D5F
MARRIAAVLDLSWLRKELAPHYSHTGLPSIDPEHKIRMLVIGYVFAIRSERALCREFELNLACLGIEDKIPDHSAFTRASASTTFSAKCSSASLLPASKLISSAVSVLRSMRA